MQSGLVFLEPFRLIFYRLNSVVTTISVKGGPPEGPSSINIDFGIQATLTITEQLPRPHYYWYTYG